MKKLLFFDYLELEYVEGFAGAPLLRPELPWEQGNNRLLGSVVLAAKWSH